VFPLLAIQTTWKTPAQAEIRFIASQFLSDGVHKKAGRAGRSDLKRIRRYWVAPEASFSDDDCVGRDKTFYQRDLRSAIASFRSSLLATGTGFPIAY
jgi:hypothetical protein